MPRKSTFAKSPPELVERFSAVLDRVSGADVVRRKMFGYPCAFVGGHMTTGLFGASWFVRLPEAGQAEVLALPGGRVFEAMPGRPMRGYVLLPANLVADDAAIDGWVARAIEHAGTLPAKA